MWPRVRAQQAFSEVESKHVTKTAKKRGRSEDQTGGSHSVAGRSRILCTQHGAWHTDLTHTANRADSHYCYCLLLSNRSGDE